MTYIQEVFNYKDLVDDSEILTPYFGSSREDREIFVLHEIESLYYVGSREECVKSSKGTHAQKRWKSAASS